MHLRVCGLFLFSAMTLLAPIGCTDGDAQQRDDVQAAIVSAQQKLHKMRLESASFAPDQLDGLKQKLEAVSRELTAITGGDPGQQAARAMLTATALRELADLNMARAGEIEARLQDERSVVAARIEVVQALDAVAAGYTSINPQTDLEMLSSELGIAQQRLETLAQKLAELEGPIAERTGANAKATEEVNRLKVEVGDLQRQADEQGYARGFPLHQKAIETQREADKIEYDISLREMDLAYDYQAEADLAGAQAGHAKERIETIESSQVQLDEFKKSTAGNAANTSALAGELATQVAADLKQLSEQMTNELTPLYDQAQAALEKAASQAQQAIGQTRGEDAAAARLLKARALEAQGRLAWTRSRGLAEQLALLKKLEAAQSPSAASIGNVNAQITDADAGRIAAVDQAKNAYTEAQATVEQVTVRSDQAALDRFKHGLEVALALLSGGPVPVASAAVTDAPGDSAPVADATAVGDPSQGFASPEALLRFLQSLDGDTDLANVMRQMSDAMRAETPEGKKAVMLTRQVGGVLASLAQAMEIRFGREVGAAAQTQLAADSGLPSFANASITNKTETEATIITNAPAGDGANIDLIQANGRWFMNADSLSPEELAQLETMPQMIAAMQDFANRLRNGEFTTLEEMTAALQQAMGGPGASNP